MTTDDSNYNLNDWEEHFRDDRKLSRQDRKRKSAKDRSKFKKTDQKQLQKQPEEIPTDLPRGRVLSIISEEIKVATDHGTLTCTLRGTLKKEKQRLKNLVTVGDFVRYEPLPDQEGVIHFIEPRQSILSRADTLDHRREQLIAANIDQVLITTSVVFPPLKPALIDRYIIATQKGNMTPIILVNKIDLLEDEEHDLEIREQEKLLYYEMLNAYKIAEIQIIPISITTGEGLSALKELMKDKASVFSGQSGVGKSSLINATTGLDLQVGDPVKRTKKGSHTTTRAQLIPLSFGGWCIDTPGIKSFGVWDIEKSELEHYFHEIQEIGNQCKFPDCSHTHETQCAVIQAVEDEKLSSMRYESYCYLLETIEEKHRRR